MRDIDLPTRPHLRKSGLTSGAPPAKREASDSPLEGGLDLVFRLLVFEFPFVPRRRAGSSGTWAFSFASVFFLVKENEETMFEKTHRIGGTSTGPLPKVLGLDHN
jgi:hypothetical protein